MKSRIIIGFIATMYSITTYAQDSVDVAFYYVTQYKKSEILFIRYNKELQKKRLPHSVMIDQNVFEYAFMDSMVRNDRNISSGIYKLLSATPYYYSREIVEFPPFIYKDIQQIFISKGIVPREVKFEPDTNFFKIDNDTVNYYQLDYVKGKAIRRTIMLDHPSTSNAYSCSNFEWFRLDLQMPAFYHYMMYDYTITRVNSLNGFKRVDFTKELEKYRPPVRRKVSDDE